MTHQIITNWQHSIYLVNSQIYTKFVEIMIKVDEHGKVKSDYRELTSDELEYIAGGSTSGHNNGCHNTKACQGTDNRSCTNSACFADFKIA